MTEETQSERPEVTLAKVEEQFFLIGREEFENISPKEADLANYFDTAHFINVVDEKLKDVAGYDTTGPIDYDREVETHTEGVMEASEIYDGAFEHFEDGCHAGINNR